MSVGYKLKEIREAYGMTQGEFANMVGTKRTTYVSYEADKTCPDFLFVHKVSKIFNIPLDQFLAKKEFIPKGIGRLNSVPTVYNVGKRSDKESLDEEEKFIIQYFRILDEEERFIFLSQIRSDYLDKKCNAEEE